MTPPPAPRPDPHAPEPTPGPPHGGPTPGPDDADTIVAPATPPGGAVGIVRLSGPRAIDIAAALAGRKPAGLTPRRLARARLRDPATGEELDDAMLAVFPAPGSYTGEDCAEMQCHGSPYVMRRLQEAAQAQGARPARPGEFTMRAWLRGRLDLSQAEAVAALVAAQHQGAHRLAMEQLRGSVSRRLSAFRERLLAITSLLELELDFAEEHDILAPRERLLALCRETEDELSALLATFGQGQATLHGTPVAIVGPPNVGKSTLFNALAGDDRAIVSPRQGTTRDTVEATATIHGRLFRLTDTAGLRPTDDPVELMGQERARRAAARARIVIVMTEPGGEPEPRLPLSPGQTVLRVVNKTRHFQARSGRGLAALRRALSQAAPSPADAQATLTSPRHRHALSQALADIRRTRRALSQGLPPDLAAQDLRQCLHHIGQVTGHTITPAQVLRNIFSHFCIGK